MEPLYYTAVLTAPPVSDEDAGQSITGPRRASAELADLDARALVALLLWQRTTRGGRPLPPSGWTVTVQPAY